MSGVSLVYTLFPDDTDARTAARTLVLERLAACANIVSPCTSFYVWKEALEENNETPVLFKTTPDKAQALVARIAELHEYDIPAILSWNADIAHSPFAAWVNEQVKE